MVQMEFRSTKPYLWVTMCQHASTTSPCTSGLCQLKAREMLLPANKSDKGKPCSSVNEERNGVLFEHNLNAMCCLATHKAAAASSLSLSSVLVCGHHRPRRSHLFRLKCFMTWCVACTGMVLCLHTTSQASYEAPHACQTWQP